MKITPPFFINTDDCEKDDSGKCLKTIANVILVQEYEKYCNIDF